MFGFFSFQSLETELVCSTAYMELFIRRITEPKLLAIFLRFLFTEMHDQDTIIDIMVHRLTLQSQVSKTFTISQCGNLKIFPPRFFAKIPSN